MLYTAEKQPAVFFATCARLLPNDVRVTVEQQLPGNLSMEDWQMMKEIIAAVRQAIPDASSKPPGAVLEHVLTALWAADAKGLDSSENAYCLHSCKHGEALCHGKVEFAGHANY